MMMTSDSIMTNNSSVFPLILSTVRLIPKTRHARNRVREHGELGEVIQIRSSSFCTITADGDWRWIDVPVDKDFDWLPLREKSS